MIDCLIDELVLYNEVMKTNPWKHFSGYLNKMHTSLYMEHSEHHNQLISPIALNLAMILLMLGARGETYSQLKDLTGTSSVTDLELFALAKYTMKALASSSNETSFHAQNRIYLEESLTPRPLFKKTHELLTGTYTYVD